MKTTGIIRRIDDLGRIVIPKEIRKNLKIKNYDSLEIFLNDDEIILKKYSAMESIEQIAQKYTDSFNNILKRNIIVIDKNNVIAASGSLRKKYLGREITSFAERCIERRDNFSERTKKNFEFVKDNNEYGFYSFCSIVSNTDTIGGVILISLDNVITETEEKIVVVISKLLSNNFLE